MALLTCYKHTTSDDETAVVVYESYPSSYSVAKCPVCEADEEGFKLRVVLVQAIHAFECTQIASNYPSDHWIHEAKRLVS
jgi:hypothetical protein